MTKTEYGAEDVSSREYGLELPRRDPHHLAQEGINAILASTKDIVLGDVRPGGPAYYSSIALYLLGHTDFRVLTTVSLTYSSIRKLGIDVVPVGYGETVFNLKVDDGRVLTLVERAYMNPKLVVENLASTNVLISLTAGELEPDVLKHVVSGRRVVVDIQGFVRRVDANGIIVNDYSGFWVLGGLKGKELVLRGEVSEFPPECRGVNIVRCATELGASLILTSASGPTYFALSNGFGGTLKPPQGVAGDSIGSGDVFTAVLAYNYLTLGEDFIESIAKAAVAATLKLRSRFPWYTITEVEAMSEKVLRTIERITY